MSRPARYAHTAECRDDYCVHPIQCETDGICPPAPGGEVDVARRAFDLGAERDMLGAPRPEETR